MCIRDRLNTIWYSKYPRSKFHFFNDNAEWLQVDKAGHAYGAYIESFASYEMWRWSGLPRKKRIWTGGLSGIAYETIIETLDGFSAEYGWSWGDFGSNLSLIHTDAADDLTRVDLGGRRI